LKLQSLIIPGLGENSACYGKISKLLNRLGYETEVANLHSLATGALNPSIPPIFAIANEISEKAKRENKRYAFCLSFSIGASITMLLDDEIFQPNSVKVLVDPIIKASPARLATIKSSLLALRKECHSGIPKSWERWDEQDRVAKLQSLKGWTDLAFDSILNVDQKISLDFQSFLQNKGHYFVIPKSSSLSGIDWVKGTDFANVLFQSGSHEIQRENPRAILTIIQRVLNVQLS
jgi:hypothetical protein